MIIGENIESIVGNSGTKWSVHEKWGPSEGLLGELLAGPFTTEASAHRWAVRRGYSPDHFYTRRCPNYFSENPPVDPDAPLVANAQFEAEALLDALECLCSKRRKLAIARAEAAEKLDSNVEKMIKPWTVYEKDPFDGLLGAPIASPFKTEADALKWVENREFHPLRFHLANEACMDARDSYIDPEEPLTPRDHQLVAQNRRTVRALDVLCEDDVGT